jgi:phage gp45-like
MTLDDMKRFIAPLQRRVMLAIGRGTLGPVNDADGLQRSQVKLLAGEVRDNVERIQPYGFSAVPFRCLVSPPAGVDPALTGFRQGG